MLAERASKDSPMLHVSARDILTLEPILNEAYRYAPGPQAKAALRVLIRAHVVLQQQPAALAAGQRGGRGSHVLPTDDCADAPPASVLPDDNDDEPAAADGQSADSNLEIIVRAGEHGQLSLLRRAGAEQRARWIAAGPHGWLACGRAAGALHVGPGNAHGSKAALAEVRSHTLVCLTPGCHALVDRGRARFNAHAAGRDYYVAGDGCASRHCSNVHRCGRFAERQQAMAVALEMGERKLIDWPCDLGDHDVWMYSRASACCAAAAARRALNEQAGTCRRGRKRKAIS